MRKVVCFLLAGITAAIAGVSVLAQGSKPVDIIIITSLILISLQQQLRIKMRE